MPGLVPGIHVLPHMCTKDVDGRVKPGHDEKELSAQLAMSAAGAAFAPPFETATSAGRSTRSPIM
jgi:hypothetical protein